MSHVRIAKIGESIPLRHSCFVDPRRIVTLECNVIVARVHVLTDLVSLVPIHIKNLDDLGAFSPTASVSEAKMYE